jgi:IS5 family transposase
LYTFSDGQTKYQLKDRWSFMRCVGLAPHGPVPDAKTIWLFGEQLARASVVERLFAWLDALLWAKALAGKGRADRRCEVDRGAGSGLTKADGLLKGDGIPSEWKPARRVRRRASEDRTDYSVARRPDFDNASMMIGREFLREVVAVNAADAMIIIIVTQHSDSASFRAVWIAPAAGLTASAGSRPTLAGSGD